MGFSRQEYWSGVPLPSPGDLPDPRVKPGPPSLQADALPSEPPGKHREPGLIQKLLSRLNPNSYRYPKGKPDVSRSWLLTIYEGSLVRQWGPPHPPSAWVFSR